MDTKNNTEEPSGHATCTRLLARCGKPPVPSLIVAAMCILLAIAFQWPFLTDPYWNVLDDASRVINASDVLAQNPTLETLMSMDASRSRPFYWIFGAALHTISPAEPWIFWHANWILLAGGMYAAYLVARIFTASAWTAALAPIFLYAMPPVVPVYSETSGQESLMLLFGGLFIYYLLKADRLLEDSASWKRAGTAALFCWISGALFVFSKEPSAAGVAFPVGWMILGLPLSTKGTILKKRLPVLMATFLWMTVLSALIVARISGVIDGGANDQYLGNYAMNWQAIATAHKTFMTMLLARIWPVLVIPLLTVGVALASLRSFNREQLLAYLRPFLFLLGIAVIQYAVVLPWIPMVKNLLPSCLPLAAANAICIDCLLTLRKGPQPAN